MLHKQSAVWTGHSPCAHIPACSYGCQSAESNWVHRVVVIGWFPQGTTLTWGISAPNIPFFLPCCTKPWKSRLRMFPLLSIVDKSVSIPEAWIGIPTPLPTYLGCGRGPGGLGHMQGEKICLCTLCLLVALECSTGLVKGSGLPWPWGSQRGFAPCLSQTGSLKPGYGAEQCALGVCGFY